MKQIFFKNTAISFSDIGKGTAVVLLHGFLENKTMWKDLVPSLAEKNRMISIDLLGHGCTTGISAHDRAKTILALTDPNIKNRQLATALYFIDNLALRVGGSKDTKEEADTVGVTSLRVEHLTFMEDNTIKLDFLGKDYRFSVVYDLLSLTFNSRLRLKVFINEITAISSIVSIFKNASCPQKLRS